MQVLTSIVFGFINVSGKYLRITLNTGPHQMQKDFFQYNAN